MVSLWSDYCSQDNITPAMTMGVTIVLIHLTSSLLFSLERSPAERPSNVFSHLQKAGIIWWEWTVGAPQWVIWKGQLPEELQHHPPLCGCWAPLGDDFWSWLSCFGTCLSSAVGVLGRERNSKRKLSNPLKYFMKGRKNHEILGYSIVLGFQLGLKVQHAQEGLWRMPAIRDLLCDTELSSPCFQLLHLIKRKLNNPLH